MRAKRKLASYVMPSGKRGQFVFHCARCDRTTTHRTLRGAKIAQTLHARGHARQRR